jgi:hypothetical protein
MRDNMKTNKKRTTAKTKLDSVLNHLQDHGFTPELTGETYQDIINSGLRSKNLPLAFVATQLALEQNPITLRGLLYRIVSAGWLPSTDHEHYTRTGRIMTTLREAGTVPFSWIVDNVRTTEKPSSWSGLNDFADTVAQAYRKDFWAQLPDYVHIICEKDAIAGVLSPVTRKYDVALSPIRGYVSLSFANAIAATWNEIDKPIFAFYVGDFDPSGFDLERDAKEKLTRYCNHSFEWVRLGVNREDFEEFDLISLKPKKTDKRCHKFVEEHGSQCAELDALPATELRSRIENAILEHVDMERWIKLEETERIEKENVATLLTSWKEKS